MLDSLRLKFRRHKFDLKTPVNSSIGQYVFDGFRCSACGKTLWLSLWQMHELPFSMARGCPGVINPAEPTSPTVFLITPSDTPEKPDPCDTYVPGIARPFARRDTVASPCKCGHQPEGHTDFCPLCGTVSPTQAQP